MKKIPRSLTVKTQSGKTVTVKVTINGTLGESSRNNTPDKSYWYISNVDTESPDRCNDGWALSQDEKNEVEKLIGERIDAEVWNFDQA